jgi:DNA-binding NtrC family response regulator
MNSARMLFLGSEDSVGLVRRAADQAGLSLDQAVTWEDLFSKVHLNVYSVVLAEFPFAGAQPPDLLDAARRNSNPAMVIFLLGGKTRVSEAARLAKMGAYQCVDAGMEPGLLAGVFEDALDEVRSRRLAMSTTHEGWRKMLVGASPCMHDMARVIELVASRRCTVLITGETGTGKEVAARAIHAASDRSHLPMVALNCSAIPEHLLEAELFGHTRGAFTGAVAPRAGRFEQAHNSTLFLDEIGEMPVDLQAKLLRVLQERELQRLGSSETIKVNVRVIAATNMDLAERVKQGKFREDLYYRLNVVPIEMPPLRERAGDIALLARHFIAKVCRAEGIPLKEVFNETLEHLQWYTWPGNVRQLENLVEKAVVMSGHRNVLLPCDFPLPTDSGRLNVMHAMPPFAVPEGGLDFAKAVNVFEKNILHEALRKTNGNKTMAADLLRLKRTTLVSKLRVL